MQSSPTSTRTRTLSWVLRVLVAVILGQTLFFKFSGAKESIYIFETLGMEPWGRYGSGALELLAVLLLLSPRGIALGALISAGVLAGAILSHLTRLGIEVQGDGGLLFGLGLVAFAGSLALLFLHAASLPLVGPMLANRTADKPSA